MECGGSSVDTRTLEGPYVTPVLVAIAEISVTVRVFNVRD